MVGKHYDAADYVSRHTVHQITTLSWTNATAIGYRFLVELIARHGAQSFAAPNPPRHILLDVSLRANLGERDHFTFCPQ